MLICQHQWLCFLSHHTNPTHGELTMRKDLYLVAGFTTLRIV
ncbi:hypothetical protein CRENPOLYSF1_450026 [Crenothrix polyspora]|uniref:Uncharacterized protein n=1 Tax=Crenothrix polyspora TaxID=360316 RepID=A0A1R4HBV0_9GAMM|nr:hypothetical protein CRENPOLYSF1_450026 [Crenothrix polyspora]